MRVVSWNVRSLRDGRSSVAATLRRLEPDVVLLQEAPRLVLWRVSRLLLARSVGMRLVTWRKAAGNCVLARVPVETPYARGFPKGRGLHRRGTAGVVVRLDGRPLAVVGTHLDLVPSARVVTAGRVRALAPDLPLVVGADVNEPLGGPAWAVLAGGLVDHGTAPTYPAAAPRQRIDLLAASPSLSVRLQVLPTTASDHCVLVADVSWAVPPAG